MTYKVVLIYVPIKTYKLVVVHYMYMIYLNFLGDDICKNKVNEIFDRVKSMIVKEVSTIAIDIT
jgi:hypothetical protein